MQSRALLQHIVRTLAASGLYLVSQVVASVLIARMLGVEGRGQVTAAVLIPMLVAYAGELGLPVATGFLIGTRDTSRRMILATAQTLAAAISGVLLLVAVALIMLVPLESETRLAAFVFLPFIPSNVFQRVYLAALQADSRMGAFNGVRVAGATLYLGIVVALYSSGSGGIATVVLAQLAGNVAWSVLPLLFLRPLPWFGFDTRTARALLSYGARAHLGGMSPIDTLRADQLLVAVLLGTHDLGLYVAAMTFITANRMVGVSIGMVAFSLSVNGRNVVSSGVPRQLFLLMTSAVAFALPLAAIEIKWSSDLLRVILGADFEAAARPLAILAAASILMNLRQVLSDWLRGSGRAGVASAGEAFSLVVLCVSAFAFREAGVTGVAWAMLLASTFSLITVVSFTLSGVVRSSLSSHDGPGFVLPVLAIVLFIASGLAPTLLGVGNELLLLIGLTVLFVGPVVWRLCHKDFDIFDPIVWVALAFLAMFVIRPAWRISSGDFSYNGYDVRDGLFMAMGVSAVAYCAILVGYSLTLGARIGEALPRTPSKFHSSTVLTYSLVISIVGVFLFAMFVVGSGGISFLSAYVSSRSVEQSTAFRDSSAYLYYAPYLSIPALLLLIRCAPRNTRVVYWLMAIAPASLALLNSFGRGNRVWLLPLLGSLCILYYLSSQRRPRAITLTVCAIVVLVLFSAMRESRFAEQHSSLGGELVTFVREPHEAVLSLIESGDLGMVDALALEVTVVPDKLPFRHGVVIASSVARPVPSLLWSDKPISSDEELNRFLWLDRYERTSYLPTFSALGELYADSGIAGIVVGMAGLGVMLRIVREYWRNNAGNPFAQILFALTLPLLIVYLRGNLGDTLGRALFLVVPILAIPSLARVGRGERAAVPRPLSGEPQLVS